MDKNIILIGFMGCGKTTIGKILASEINWKFIDIDKQIQEEMKMSISEIFNRKGEKYFRKLERNFCKLASMDVPSVISTGGGIIKGSTNVDVLKRNGIFVYLESSPEKIYRNIKNDNSRPLLNTPNKKEKIKELLEERKPLYEACADITVNVSEMSANKTVACIIEKLNMLSEI